MKTSDLFIKNTVVNALGKYFSDSEITDLLSWFSEKPNIYNEPVKHDGTDTINYEFLKSGVSLGFDLNKKLEFAYFYLKSMQDYQSCKINIINGISNKTKKNEILKVFGIPYETGEANELFGLKFSEWISYDMGKYRLRFAFEEGTTEVEKISFILTEAVPK